MEALDRIPHLLATPAAVRFISAEPLLGPIDLTDLRNWVGLGEGQRWLNALGSGGSGYTGFVWEGEDACSVPRLDWVIVGGESGPDARPMHPEWARALRDQCAAAGVPLFFKQWGAHVHATQCDLDINWSWTEVWIDESTVVAKVGKKRAGRHLDGVEHSEMPRVTA
jgi:protein gp37